MDTIISPSLSCFFYLIYERCSNLLFPQTQQRADLITDEELSEDYIIPKAFDKRVGKAVAKAVADAARETGVARL